MKLLSYRIKFQKKKFLCSINKNSFLWIFIGKIRDRGSNFSHETPKVAAGDLAAKGNFFFWNFTVRKNPAENQFDSQTGFLIEKPFSYKYCSNNSSNCSLEW